VQVSRALCPRTGDGAACETWRSAVEIAGESVFGRPAFVAGNRALHQAISHHLPISASGNPMKRAIAIMIAGVLLLGVSGCLRPLTKRMDKLSDQMDEVNGRLALVNEQLGEINHGLGQVEKGVDKLNQKIDVLNAKIDKTNEQLAMMKELDEHMGKVVKSADEINKKITTIADLINRLTIPPKK
jgi:uncharacterized protein YoxC